MCGNVAENIIGLQEDFDAIVCGYSLHHLTIQEKEAVFSNCRRILREGGLLLIYDIVRKRNESRDEYLNRYWNISERRWINISKEETAIIKAHALESDLPRTWIISRIKPINTDSNGWRPLIRTFTKRLR